MPDKRQTVASRLVPITTLAEFSDAEYASLKVPDPLTFDDGTRVETPQSWRARRTEIIATAAREMYGCMPECPETSVAVCEEDPLALDGLATRRQIVITLKCETGDAQINLLLYLPNHAQGPAPTVLSLNFQGNHTITDDPAVLLPPSKTVLPDSEDRRGAAKSRWPVREILKRGYAFATAWKGDLDPDRKDGYASSVRALYPSLQARGDNFSVIAAWSWMFSRVLDCLLTEPRIDARRVIAFGHSRLGKAALWAAANDERFAMVISNDSGAGGAKLFRRGYGESVTMLNTNFPHWFCRNFTAYDGQDAALPFDQHLILAAVAPRPLYVASAHDDDNADPEGEFLSAKRAGCVYRLLGEADLPATRMPLLDHPAHGRIGYHVRTGKHDVTAYDWEQFLKFADSELANRRPDE